jgi:hypothetical protein
MTRRKKEEAIKSTVSAIKNILTIWAVAIKIQTFFRRPKRSGGRSFRYGFAPSTLLITVLLRLFGQKRCRSNEL